MVPRGGLRRPDAELLEKFDRHLRWTNSPGGGGRFEASDLDLSGMDLAGIELSGALLVRVSLDGADLRDANLAEAWVSSSSMRGANLTRANLVKVEIERTDAREAILVGCRMAGFDASRVDLRAGDLSGSSGASISWWKSDLRGARMRDLPLQCTFIRDTLMDEVDLGGSSGTVHRKSRIHLGDAGQPEPVEGEALLDWLRGRGVEATWCE